MTKKYKMSAAALTAILVGGGLYFYEPSESPESEPQKKISQPSPIKGYGIIDLARIKNKHPDSSKLNELIGREARLKLELKATMLPYQPPQIKPEIDPQPFEKSSREKNMQEVMSKLSAFKAKKIQIAEKFREESQEEYLRRRDAVRSVYLNAALNVTLKLENADNLRLTQEEVEKLQDELEQIRQERNRQQKIMLDEWTKEINDKVESATAEEEKKLRAEVDKIREQSTTEADEQIRQTQERNKALTENTIQEIEARQKRRGEILEELGEVSAERELLENKIFNSIVDEAGKLGALSRLEMVFVKDQSRDVNFLKLPGEYTFDLHKKNLQGAKIYYGKGTVDLTKDLIKAMDLKGVSTE